MPTYQATPLSGVPAAAPSEGAAAEDALDPTGQKPHGYYREAYFGTLAPCRRTVSWNGHENTVTLRILEADEARQCSHFAYVRSGGHVEAPEYLEARTIALIAMALESVDGKAVADECKTLEHRLQLAAELSESLQEALVAAYDESRYEPLQFLEEMRQAGDPFDATPTAAGYSPEPAVFPTPA